MAKPTVPPAPAASPPPPPASPRASADPSAAGSLGPLAASRGFDRRRTPRVALDRPVKLRLGVHGRFLPGRCLDQSDGGLLVKLGSVAWLPMHQRVAVAVAAPGRVVVRSGELREALVVRCEPSEQGCRVALSFKAAAMRAAG